MKCNLVVEISLLSLFIGSLMYCVCLAHNSFFFFSLVHSTLGHVFFFSNLLLKISATFLRRQNFVDFFFTYFKKASNRKVSFSVRFFKFNC